ncbi:MAG: hypothetical protein IT492_02560 [Gammaproteobacteria bacterium]|nr:hypothetical protein [Gammaproteobacteria bacterium]
MSPQALSAVRNTQLEAEARALYSSSLPYHNFDHIQDTLESAEKVVERCREEHIRIDAEVVYFALLFHDAGYQDDHLARGFATKERYSAALAEPILRRHGVSQAQLDKTVAAILATERDAVCVSAEQKAVRAADLSGLAADYPRFLHSSMCLKREHELLFQRTLSWAEWQTSSAEVLGHYLTQEIRLTSYFHDGRGESLFHKAVRSNLARLLAEPSEPTVSH